MKVPDDKMLSQEEIDALLNQGGGDNKEKSSGEESAGEQQAQEAGEQQEQETHEQGKQEDEPRRIIESEVIQSQEEHLSAEEKDALGEVGNISMGSASTTLSELLGQRVSITSPKVRVLTQEELFKAFQLPYMIIQVQFKEGLAGFNVLIMQLNDAMVMADLMMGGDGSGASEQITEMEVSAASEAMNQMVGTASTSLATVFQRDINIEPPQTQLVESPETEGLNLPMDDPIVVVSFRLTIGELLDTEIMQIMHLETAKNVASLLWDGITGMQAPQEPVEETPSGETPAAGEDTGKVPEPQPQPEGGIPGPGFQEQAAAGLDIDPKRLQMLMDIPLNVEVVLGRAKKPVKEVQGYTPGAILELESEVDQSVDILVNGVHVARGEVVVVNENFGVRITEILTPQERVEKLTE